MGDDLDYERFMDAIRFKRGSQLWSPQNHARIVDIDTSLHSATAKAIHGASAYALWIDEIAITERDEAAIREREALEKNPLYGTF